MKSKNLQTATFVTVQFSICLFSLLMVDLTKTHSIKKWSKFQFTTDFLKHNLDALFLATNAPGRSAFNRVERRMAPLSREIAGLILPYNSFGSHLDDNGKTVDNELEKKNFQHAGEILWSKVVVDGCPTVSEYIISEDSCRNQT